MALWIVLGRLVVRAPALLMLPAAAIGSYDAVPWIMANDKSGGLQPTSIALQTAQRLMDGILNRSDEGASFTWAY